MPEWTADYDRYLQLIDARNVETFLDVDTPLIIAIRDDIQGYLNQGKYTKLQLEKLAAADKEFQRKARLCKKAYEHTIQSGDSNSDYLKMVLDGIRYPDNHDSHRWWFHLID